MALRLIRDLLGAPGCLAAVALAFVTQGLIPASGDRDRTISPYAAYVSSSASALHIRERPPLPASHVRDDRDTPLLVEAGCAEKIIYFRKTEDKYFSLTALT